MASRNIAVLAITAVLAVTGVPFWYFSPVAAGAQDQAQTPATHDPKILIFNRIPRFVGDFIIACLAGVILFCVISVILFLFSRPHPLQFTIVSAAVSPINATDSDLGVSWSFSILFHNPISHIGVYHDRLEIAVLYGEDFLLSKTRLEPIYQGKHNTTLLKVHLVSSKKCKLGFDRIRLLNSHSS